MVFFFDKSIIDFKNSIIGYTTGENVTLHYHASGVILNHNYTEEYFKKDLKDCETCKQLAADVKEGVSCKLYFQSQQTRILYQNPWVLRIPGDGNERMEAKIKTQKYQRASKNLPNPPTHKKNPWGRN